MSWLRNWLHNRGLLDRKQSSGVGTDIGRHRLAPRILCEVDVGREQLQRLFDYVVADWTTLGEIEPYWSVLTHERFRTASIAKHKSEFYRSGTLAEQFISAFFARNEAMLNTNGTCLELGCGIGRVTATLAKMFNRVIALDVSPSHLTKAREALADLELRNVDLWQLHSVSDIQALPKFDLLFSQITLQHNPPPVIALLLEQAFVRLEPGGYCLFQVPTYQNGYRFLLSDYLQHRHNERNRTRLDPHKYMEMHILPQRVIYRLMREAGIELLEVVEDGDCGDVSFQSVTFFGRKPA